MIKHIIILMNILVLYVVRIFFAADVNVKIEAPSQVKQGEEFTISLTINKGSIAGVGHMMQTLPVGFGNATVVETKGSVFKYFPEAVKFIWIALPADHEFTVSYKVKVNTDAPTGNVILAGKFSYVIDNRKQTFIVPDVSITVSEETIPTTTIPISIGIETTETTATTTTTAETAKTSANPGIVFKVQIGAFKESVPTATTNKFRRIARQDIKTYKNEKGLTIYTVGEFSEFESADNLKTQIISEGLSDAFVIAFKDGKRISISAALEIIRNR